MTADHHITYARCHKCNLPTDIEMLDGKDDGSGNFETLECPGCYGPGWASTRGDSVLEGGARAVRPEGTDGPDALCAALNRASRAERLCVDLWDFIENVTDEDPARQEKFFALRARYRGAVQG